MDARVAELVRIGSDDALDALYARYASEIQGVAFLILRDRFEAEDVMAETLITAWRRGRDLRDGAALRPWLMRIATNHALAMRRNRRPVAALPEVDLPAPDSTGPLAGRIALLAAVDRLPLEMRAAVVLHYYADLTVDEVARALGKSPNTVKSQLRVGLEQLRAAWDGGRADRRFQDVG
ncbi:MAG TPA: sigma-70 family RNA polymerase sigma factor [Candidatus Limnocylindrales bacterium]